MEAILDKLLQLTPLWVILIVALIFIATKFYYSRFKVIERTVKDADCNEHKNCINSTSETVNTLKSDIVEIKRDIAIIKAYLVGESD